MLIKRTILDDLKKHLDRPEITILTGARQVGKTRIKIVPFHDLIFAGL